MVDSANDTGKIVMMDVDYATNCDTKIPECKKLAQEGKLHDALDQLLALEKLARTVKQDESRILDFVTGNAIFL